ncbi:Transposase [compost metagenome]
MTKTRRSFTNEFKCEAVRLVKQPGAMSTHIARDLGIEASVLRRWVNQEREGILDMRTNRPIRSKAVTELERLQCELRRVTMERDILKKRSATLPGTRSEVRLQCCVAYLPAHCAVLTQTSARLSHLPHLLHLRPAFVQHRRCVGLLDLQPRCPGAAALDTKAEGQWRRARKRSL